MPDSEGFAVGLCLPRNQALCSWTWLTWKEWGCRRCQDSHCKESQLGWWVGGRCTVREQDTLESSQACREEEKLRYREEMGCAYCPAEALAPLYPQGITPQCPAGLPGSTGGPKILGLALTLPHLCVCGGELRPSHMLDTVGEARH